MPVNRSGVPIPPRSIDQNTFRPSIENSLREFVATPFFRKNAKRVMTKNPAPKITYNPSLPFQQIRKEIIDEI